MSAPSQEEIAAYLAANPEAFDAAKARALPPADSGPTAEELAAARRVLALEDARNKPKRWRVIVSNNMFGDRVLFSSVSQKRARAFVERSCPRGSHFFLRSPDNVDESYEHERHTGGPQGEEYDSAWAPFDRDAYQAPELAPVNTNDPWADAWEGAQ